MENRTPRVAVIMAGGQGERFWPQSRRDMPKQFLSLTGDGKTLFQLTVERMRQLCRTEDIFVVTNARYCDIVLRQEPQLPRENILCEPCPKNTAPALAFAAGVAAARYGDAVLLVVPSDHVIANQRLFADILREAADFAEASESLVTLGITPTYPETGYGYIRFGEKAAPDGPGVYKVDAFVEKPALSTAKEYLESGNYLWNSGMFVWRASTFAAGLAAHCPPAAALLSAIRQADGRPDFEQTLGELFAQAEGISIDYALMEKADNIYTIPSSFAWNDVGSWNAIGTINPADPDGNVLLGSVIAEDCRAGTFVSNGRLIAAAGVEDIIVVETPDAVLVCDKSSAQDVKKLVARLKAGKMEEYL